MRIYIAGPYTNGDSVENVRNAVFAGDEILELGHYPYIPHLTHLWHTISPKAYNTWLSIDIEFLKVCDAILRLPGESSGADSEVGLAAELGIPIFYSIEDIPKTGKI